MTTEKARQSKSSGARSLQEALAAYASTPPVVAAFNWSRVVAAHSPGSETRQQRRQSARLRWLQRDLTRWARRYSLPVEHAQRAAYFTVVATAVTSPVDQVTAVARTIFWIYVLDDFLDRREATVKGLGAIDRDLGAILTPLRRGLELPRRPRTVNLLGELLAATSTSSPSRRPASAVRPTGRIDQGEEDLSFHLEEALAGLLMWLDRSWGVLSRRSEALDYRRTLVCRQVARCMASMRREFTWNVQLASHAASGAPGEPSLGVYLTTGSVSIGMLAVAAVVTSFELEPRRAWGRGWAAIDTAGRIVRLANDLATYRRERAEGKLSSLTLMLGELGSPPAGADPVSDDELERAAGVLRESLRQLIAFFGFTSNQLAEFPILRLYLRHVVAFALAVYAGEEKSASASG